MVTTHQIRNVLRVYGNQLKRRNTLVQETLEPDRRYHDQVEISTEARHKQALNRMSEHVMSHISVSRNSGDAGETQ
mgnify:CR=1 FL=1